MTWVCDLRVFQAGLHLKRCATYWVWFVKVVLSLSWSMYGEPRKIGLACSVWDVYSFGSDLRQFICRQVHFNQIGYTWLVWPLVVVVSPGEGAVRVKRTYCDHSIWFQAFTAWLLSFFVGKVRASRCRLRGSDWSETPDCHHGFIVFVSNYVLY